MTKSNTITTQFIIFEKTNITDYIMLISLFKERFQMRKWIASLISIFNVCKLFFLCGIILTERDLSVFVLLSDLIFIQFLFRCVVNFHGICTRPSGILVTCHFFGMWRMRTSKTCFDSLYSKVEPWLGWRPLFLHFWFFDFYK